MKNRFAASCAKCKKTVKVGEGKTNMVDGRWRTEHLSDDACRHALLTQRGPHVPQGRSTYARDHYDDPESEPYYGMAQHEFDPDIGDR